MKPAIDIRKLGKQYRLHEAPPYLSLRDVLSKAPWEWTGKGKKADPYFWALQNINLCIEPGERVGIIGRNGAGKSTLLKIISRITPPTCGEAFIHGRVGSLLEVGTGFHPELSGRENIFLNGSILGLKKTEIRRQLDAIIDFSGVEKFIDSPLKHYSSGMQLRLAFAVAAHLEPEILLIDEVLAVGDMEFQKKCLGKMEEVSHKDGRTILFVSHNMSYIRSLCNKALLLDNGRLIAGGNSEEIISQYISSVRTNTPDTGSKATTPPVVQLLSVNSITTSFQQSDSFAADETIGIEMEYEVLSPGHVLWLGYNLHNEEGINVFDTHSVNTAEYSEPHATGKFKAVAWIPGHMLNTGLYFISCAVFNHTSQVIYLHEKDVLAFHVYDVFDRQTARGMSPGEFPGILRPLLKWHIEKSKA
ncbi:MAG: ABC transporter ATP-binding protein [Sphingobacteriales bacterium]|nr:ABC transporter ATP-binding protein [Sphingobacteriales bacterium]